MLQSISIKAAVFTPLIFVTWFVTSTILIHNAKGKSNTQVAAPKVLKLAIDGEAQPGVINGDQSRIVSRSSLTEHDISVQGNVVIVKASVDLMSKTLAGAHLWRIRAYGHERQDGARPSLS